MVTAEKTSVIDAEFAFYGPIGFDIGAYIGNLLLSYFSQDGHSSQDTSDKNRAAYKIWLLGQIDQTWALFEKKFTALWDTQHKGDLFSFCTTVDEKRTSQKNFLRDLLADSLGYAGTKMMRRIIGVAKVEDFKSIKDESIKAKCELKALCFGRTLVSRRSSLTIAEVISLAQESK